MSDRIHLGGDERTAFEKLEMSLRLGSEAANAANYGNTMKRLRQAIEAATEVGVYRSDGRWAGVAERIEKVRTEMTTVSGPAFRIVGFTVAELLSDMYRSVVLLRMGRVH